MYLCIFAIGLCILINNTIFSKVPHDPTSKDMPPRTGSNMDRGQLSIPVNVNLMSQHFRAIVANDGPTMQRHYINVLCLPGAFIISPCFIS